MCRRADTHNDKCSEEYTCLRECQSIGPAASVPLGAFVLFESRAESGGRVLFLFWPLRLRLRLGARLRVRSRSRSGPARLQPIMNRFFGLLFFNPRHRDAPATTERHGRAGHFRPRPRRGAAPSSDSIGAQAQVVRATRARARHKGGCGGGQSCAAPAERARALANKAARDGPMTIEPTD